jgi:hypothetical protein
MGMYIPLRGFRLRYAVTTIAPYVFALPSGKHVVSFKIWNTMGNQLERFAVPSGITAPIEKITVK